MKYDLHIHSKYSRDSISSPEKIIKIAKKKVLMESPLQIITPLKEG